MKDFNDILNSGISDELLAAYIDGNTTESENALIGNALKGDSMLSEAYEIASDSVSFGSNFDWELHKGDFGFWELGLPPVVTEEAVLEKNNKTEADMAKKTYGYEPNNELDTFDPNIWQGNQPTCAIRSQEIILRDYGIYHTQEELVEFATKNGWFNPDPINGGTDKASIGNILEACGIPTTRTENATIYDIITELKAGHRVIVSVDAEELWVKKEPNLYKRLYAQVTNKANDTIQDYLGVEGANHALIVAGVNVNPKDPSDIKINLIDSGTGDVCIEYSFKDFYNAWSDGHCLMISTDIPAPFQYNYHTHQIEPSNYDTNYVPSLAVMPEGLNNQFRLSENFYSTYEEFTPSYDNESKPLDIEGIEMPEILATPKENDNSEEDEMSFEKYIENNIQDEDSLQDNFSESDSQSLSTNNYNDVDIEDNSLSCINEGEDNEDNNDGGA